MKYGPAEAIKKKRNYQNQK